MCGVLLCEARIIGDAEIEEDWKRSKSGAIGE
jgi:hypothetical protein